MPTDFDFQVQKDEWLQIPIDDVGYFSAKSLMEKPDEELRSIVESMEISRYKGWRNYKNLWRESLGLDTTTGKTILDFGCGIGIEALQFARAGNDVIVADINPETVALAQRVLKIFGFESNGLVIKESYPFIEEIHFDIFYSNGVLHHTPKAKEILFRAYELLYPNGEIRLMLYSDKGRDVAKKHGTEFVRFFDQVGFYADWYDVEKLKNLAPGFEKMTYITEDERYLTAIYKK